MIIAAHIIVSRQCSQSHELDHALPNPPTRPHTYILCTMKIRHCKKNLKITLPNGKKGQYRRLQQTCIAVQVDWINCSISKLVYLLLFSPWTLFVGKLNRCTIHYLQITAGQISSIPPFKHVTSSLIKHTELK